MYKKEVFASMVLKECERCILYGPGGKILMKGRVEVAGESIMLYFEKNPEFAKVL